jgi:hypothetical protein
MCNITKIFKTLKAHFFPKRFVGRIRPFFHQSETTIWKHFFSNIIVLFFIQRSKMSRNMHKLCVKLRNATIYPPWGPIWKKKKKFKKSTSPSSEMRNLFRRWHLKDIEEKSHGFEKSGGLQITFLRKVSRCVAF